MMSPRAIVAMLLALLLALGSWALYHAGRKAGADEVQTRWDAQNLQALQAQAKREREAQEQHDKDQAIIDGLRADAGRVRIHLPACPGTTENQNGSAGLVSDRVDRLFADFQGRVGGIVARCDQLNIDARRANGESGQ